ncbi:T9SS C-terminal target domain-containing protein [candidate division KSB1 bacterium]|nr:T9SS type A sorting domain-containing protein [candidate division KSB1 bacterium]RQV99748.1 MAG: T9SS C-terminal target domain-containing protein [candidate division KSB1 bacterium]
MSDRGHFKWNIFLAASLLVMSFLLAERGVGQTTVMPVGNSITAGKTPSGGTSDGFRGYLKNELGANYTFVGDDITVTPGLNGHFKSGSKIRDFLAGGEKDITVALNTHNPEIVLLHLGTNNINSDTRVGPYTDGFTPSGELKELINTIGKHQSVSSILVCKIIPKLDANMMNIPQINDFNEEIERMFFDNAISGKAVIVDMNSMVSIQELTDGIHPIEAGYQRMAGEFSRVIKAITNNPNDIYRPNPISIVEAIATDEPAISLTWWTPNDQGGGIVNLYELRYLVDREINASNFKTGTLVSIRRPDKNSPSSGQERTKVTDGLLGGRTYYFAIRVYDQNNNVSEIRSFPGQTTPDELPEPGIAFVDEFNNASFPGWSADPAYQVSNGRLRNTDPGSGWSKLAILDSIKYTPFAEFVEVGARYANSDGLGGIGLAMLLDTDDYRIASGYMIRVYGDIALYEIVNGEAGARIYSTSTSIEPGPGDTLSVVYRNNPTANSFEVKVNGNSIGIVQDADKLYGQSNILYSGLILHGSFSPQVDSYDIKIPQLEPESMVIFGDPPIFGEVEKTLGAPLSVKVLDLNGVGVANVPVDFSVLSGVGAAFSADDVCGDFNGHYYIEAELGIVESPMVKAKDNTASNDQYIYTKTNGDGLATYSFWICSGSYTLWLRAHAPDGNSNSVYFAIDNPDNLGNDASKLEFDITTDWEWSTKARRSNISLNEGFHTLYLKGREANLAIDKILFTSQSGFVPTGEGGSVPQFANITNNKGIVSTDVTFGTQAGEVVIQAISYAIPTANNFVVFPPILVNGGTPASFLALSDNIIQGEAGKALPSPFQVEVLDAYGNPRRGEQVIFEVISGDGRFSGSQVAKANTDEYGIAEAYLKLGFEPETVIDAYLNDVPEIQHLTFKGIAQEGTIPFELVRVNDLDHFDTDVNTTLSESLQVRVLNQKNNPYAGYPVKFEIIAGNGTLNGQYTTVTDSTDRDGLASVLWHIGTKAGENAHIVRVDAALNGAPIDFTASARPDDAYQMALLSGDNQSQGAGKTFADSLVVGIRDQYGNGITNYSVRFSVVSGDGNFEGITGTATANASKDVTTNKNGNAAVSYTAGPRTGPTQIRAEGLQQPPLPTQNYRIFNLTVNAPLPQSVQIVSGNSQTNEVQKDLSPFRVRILDPFGQYVTAGVKVRFQVLPGYSSLFDNEPVYDTVTDANGYAQATLTLGYNAGEQRVQVSLPNYPEVAPVEFVAWATAGPAAKLKSLSQVTFSGQAGSTVPLRVQVTDMYDNVKPGHSVSFQVDAGGVIKLPNGGTTAQLSIDSDSKGEAVVSFQMGSKVSVANKITASSLKSSGGALSGSPIEFVGHVLPGDPTQLVKETADGQSAPVATTMPTPFGVQVLDANNNPVSNVKISFMATARNALLDGLASIPPKTTNAEGRASVIYTVGTTAKTYSDTLRITLLEHNLETKYLITALPSDPARMAFASDSLWERTLGYNDNENTVVPKVKISDSYGNAVNNQHPVTFKIIQGSGSLLPGDVQEITKNTVNGIAEVTWRPGTTPGENLLQASSTANGTALIKSPLKFKVITSAGAPENIVLVQPDTNWINATANQPLQLKVKITDHWDNAIVGKAVKFKVKLPETGKGTLIDDQGREVYEITLISDAQGFAQVLFKPVVTTLTVNQVEISVDRGPNQQPLYFWVHVFGETPKAQRMQIVSSKQVTVQANALVNVEVAAFDAVSGGSRVPYHTISFSIKSGKGSLASSGNTFSTRQTGADGSNAKETWNVGPHVGRAVLVINGNTPYGSPDSVIATVQPAAPFADSSKIEVLSGLTAGIKSIVKISLLDRYGNPVSGYDLELKSPDAHATFEQPAAPTDVNGWAYGSVSSTKAGPIRIYATMKNDASFRIPEITVHVQHGTAAKLELLPGQNNIFVGNIGAILKTPLTVRVTDAYGNVVGANRAQVKFALTGGGSLEGSDASKNTAFVKTDSYGLAQIQVIMGTNPNEAHLVEASLSDPNKPSVKITFTGQSRHPVLPYALTKVSGDSLQGRVGVAMSEPFVVKVVDKDGIPVWSENSPLVQFTPVVGSGEIVDGDRKASDHYGRAYAWYKFITGGVHSIRASVGDVYVVFTAFAQAGAPVKLQPMESTTQEYIVKSILDKIKVRVTDKDDNPVNDVPILFRLVDEPQQENGATVDSAPVKTGAAGQAGVASATAQLGEKIGSYFIEATCEQLPPTEKVLFKIAATSGNAYYLGKYSGDQQFGTKNRPLVYPVVVKVMDEYLNPVPDVAVEFWANSSQGHGQPLAPVVTTNNSGLAENRWTIGANEQCDLYIQKFGLRPWPVGSRNQFAAFGVENNFPEFRNMPSDTTIYTKQQFILPLSAHDRDGDPLTYQVASGLPKEAVFDANTAMITWTPTLAGQWIIQYRVDDNKPAPEHGFDVDSIKVTVATKVEIFSFYPQHSFISIPYDGEQEFGVVATGTNVSYEWWLDNKTVPNSNVSRLPIKAADFPRGSLHSLQVVAYDATNPHNRDDHTWGMRTKVELTSFTGQSVPYRGVELNWRTSYEDGNLGFDVLKSASKSGVFEKVNAGLIQSQNGSYSFTDTTVVAGSTCFYKLEDLDIGGVRSQSEAIMVTVETPKDFMLQQNYPNPFNPSTAIRFQVPKAVETKIVIFNINGQVVKTLVDEHKNAGYYEMRWFGKNNSENLVGSGVYYIRIQAGDFTATKKMLLIR